VHRNITIMSCLLCRVMSVTSCTHFNYVETTAKCECDCDLTINTRFLPKELRFSHCR